MFFFLISEVDFLNETFSVLQKYFSVHKGKLFKSWIFLCECVCVHTHTAQEFFNWDIQIF